MNWETGTLSKSQPFQCTLLAKNEVCYAGDEECEMVEKSVMDDWFLRKGVLLCKTARWPGC
jgi:hypothetical protein